MKRAITIIAAFVVAALLTVAAQATSREGQPFEARENGVGEHLESRATSKPVTRGESLDRSDAGAVTEYGKISH